VDPLFKKASADFDEGGAKGLLLNHLSIDSQGRIVFDSSDDAGDASAGGEATRRKNDQSQEEEEVEPDSTLNMTAKELGEDTAEDVEIDIGELAARFFPNLDRLDEQDICPSLKNFDLGTTSGSMDIPFLKAPEDWRQEREKTAEAGAVGDKSGFFLDDENPAGFEDDDDGLLGNFDLPPNTGFGEGGEAWARDAAIETRLRTHDGGYENDGAGGEEGEYGEGMGAGSFDPETGEYVVSMDLSKKGGHDDVLSYFDEALQKNWAGPEHWRIRKIKDVNKSAPVTKPRKEKEVFEIDFSSPLSTSISETIYTPASSNSVISLPKKDWRSKTRNLLPDDKHFNSTQLLRLFLKPKARMGSRKAGFGGKSSGFGRKDDEAPEGEMDEGFWARKEGPAVAGDETLPQGDYDANFFQDDGLAFPGGMDDDDDMEFADAQDHFSLSGEGGVRGGLGENETVTMTVAEDAQTAFGTQLVTKSRRLRPEYVQYARVAKKVDVRRLKEELWKGMGIEGPEDVSVQSPSKQRPRANHLEDLLTGTRAITHAACGGIQDGRSSPLEVHIGDAEPADGVPEAGDERYLYQLLLHLLAAPGEREGPGN
jgi:condensin complex subunit 2